MKSLDELENLGFTLFSIGLIAAIVGTIFTIIYMCLGVFNEIETQSMILSIIVSFFICWIGFTILNYADKIHDEINE